MKRTYLSLISFLILYSCQVNDSLDGSKTVKVQSSPSQNSPQEFSLPLNSNGYARVALADVELQLPKGVSLSGFGGGDRRNFGRRTKYANYFTPSKGQLDPIRVKSMYITNGGRRVLFVSFDIVMVHPHMIKDLAKRLEFTGLKEEEIIISATHTHSGPGGLIKQKIAEMIATDKFVPDLYKSVMDQVAASILDAMDNLQEAKLFKMQFETTGIQKNRRGKPGHYDPLAHFILAQSLDGRWLGGLINLAIHGTAYGMSNLFLSADVQGGMERALEKFFFQLNGEQGDPLSFLFMSGAEGDVRPEKGGTDGIALLSERIVEQAALALPNIKELEPNIQVMQRKVDLGKARMDLKVCAEADWLPHMTINLSSLAETKPKLATAIIGDQVMMTWPGEPTTDVGYHLKDMAAQMGFPYENSMLFGVTNGYISYFVTESEVKEGGYEACNNFFKGGYKKIVSTHKLSIEAMGVNP